MVVIGPGIVETIDKAGVLGRLDATRRRRLFRRPDGAAPRPIAALIEGLEAGAGRAHRAAARADGAGRTQRSASRQSQIAGRRDEPEPVAGADAGPADARRSSRMPSSARRGRSDFPARYVTGYLLDDDGGATFSCLGGSLGRRPGLDRLRSDAATLPDRPACAAWRAGLDAIGTMPVRSGAGMAETPAEAVEITVGLARVGSPSARGHRARR